jgi:hypothetical protein
MTTLRSRTIRLAHENPELRSHLLPLLKRAAKAPAIEDMVDLFMGRVDWKKTKPSKGGSGDEVTRWNLENEPLSRIVGSFLSAVGSDLPGAEAVSEKKLVDAIAKAIAKSPEAKGIKLK